MNRCFRGVEIRQIVGAFLKSNRIWGKSFYLQYRSKADLHPVDDEELNQLSILFSTVVHALNG